MALGRTYAVSLAGMNGHVVEVEADIGHPMSTNRPTKRGLEMRCICPGAVLSWVGWVVSPRLQMGRLVSLWTELGFSKSPYNSESLRANAEGLKLLVGRGKEKRALLGQLTNLNLHPTIEGDNGVGKTSLVLVAIFDAISQRLNGTLQQTYIPIEEPLQIGADAAMLHKQALLQIAQTLLTHESYLKDLGHDTTNLSEIRRWLNEPIVTTVSGGAQVLGIGANVDKADEVNTSEGFWRSGFERSVVRALKAAFPTPESGAVVAIIDNMELLAGSKEARRVLEEMRDTTLSIHGVRWVLCGAKGIIRASVNSQRLTGRVSRPIELKPVVDQTIEALIEARLVHFATRQDAKAPVGPVEFRHLYDITNANLRDALRYAQEFCLWLHLEDELGRPQGDFLGLLQAWLAIESDRITEAIKLQPRAWKLFDDLAAAGGTCTPSDYEEYGFASPQHMRTNFAQLQKVELISAEVDEDDLRRRTVSLTSQGWIVHYSRNGYVSDSAITGGM
jgi:PAS domain-containing protein